MSEAFLSRWAKRKQEHQQDLTPKHQETETLPSETPRAPDEQETEYQQAESQEAAVELSDEDMPDVETINAQSDVSMFFSKGVSPALKQQALRKLFHQPEFNFRCPLDEYAEDYSQMPKMTSETAARLKHWAKDKMEQWLDEEEPQDTTPAPQSTDNKEADDDSIA